MKIYFELDAQIRIRISQLEYQRLSQGSTLFESFNWWGQANFCLEMSQDLYVDEGIGLQVIQASAHRIQIAIHPQVLRILAIPSKTGFLTSLDQGGHLSLEVDLKK